MNYSQSRHRAPRTEVTPSEAADEVLKRRRGRSNLIDFARYTMPTMVVDPFHEMVADALTGVVRGSIQRLMIFAPPQHGKSELTSVRLPAFWLGRRPDDPIILCSYGGDLAFDKSRQVREVVQSYEYFRLWPDRELKADSRRINLWRLAGHRGGLTAAGVGGPITGHGAQLGIIDDPFSGWEQAQSLTYRNKVWDWYKGTFRTRIWEGGAVVLIMTRWHRDDLAGRLLEDQPGQWTILRLPALAETQEERDQSNETLGLPRGLPDPLERTPGEPLSPSRFSRAYMEETRVDVGSVVWWAEYQGSPRVPEGNRFKREWFQVVDTVPIHCTRIRYWDLAATENDQSKRTAGVLLAYDPKGSIYIEHVVKGKWRPKARNEVILQTAEMDATKYGNRVKVWVEQEPGSSGVDVIDELSRILARFPFYGDKVSGDKDTRLEPFAARAEAYQVKLKRGDWNKDWLDEMAEIPNGYYRDQADATAGAYNKAATGRRAVGASKVMGRDKLRGILT